MQYHMRQPDSVRPSGITSWLQNWFGTAASKQVQEPEPLGPEEMRPAPVAMPAPFGLASYRITRRFDRGSAAFAYDGGRLWYNPIGGGIVVTRGLDVLPPATATVLNNAAVIWWPQTINHGAQPELGPLYSPDQLQALAGPLATPAAVPGFGGL
jgi:hypothetical protein